MPSRGEQGEHPHCFFCGEKNSEVAPRLSHTRGTLGLHVCYNHNYEFFMHLVITIVLLIMI